MSQTPSELKYASTHEWARVEEDGTVTIGITDHAQEALGDDEAAQQASAEAALNSFAPGFQTAFNTAFAPIAWACSTMRSVASSRDSCNSSV